MTDYEELDAQLRRWLAQDAALAQACLVEPCDCGLDGRRIAVLRCVAAGYVERPEFKDEWRLA